MPVLGKASRSVISVYLRSIVFLVVGQKWTLFTNLGRTREPTEKDNQLIIQHIKTLLNTQCTLQYDSHLIMIPSMQSIFPKFDEVRDRGVTCLAPKLKREKKITDN